VSPTSLLGTQLGTHSLAKFFGGYREIASFMLTERTSWQLQVNVTLGGRGTTTSKVRSTETSGRDGSVVSTEHVHLKMTVADFSFLKSCVLCLGVSQYIAPLVSCMQRAHTPEGDYCI